MENWVSAIEREILAFTKARVLEGYKKPTTEPGRSESRCHFDTTTAGSALGRFSAYIDPRQHRNFRLHKPPGPFREPQNTTSLPAQTHVSKGTVDSP